MGNIIGIDHGFGLIKTVHTAMTASAERYENRPPVSGGHQMEYESSEGTKHYVLGGRRSELRRDKTADDLYWVLTLGAIAAEIEATGLERTQTVTIAAGLPITDLSADGQSFGRYLHRPGEHIFRMDGHSYCIQIDAVELYPQGYAAVMPVIRELMEMSVVHIVDVGSWTTDVLTLEHGIPVAGSELSIENGVIRCFASVREYLRQTERRALTDRQIEDVLLGRTEMSAGIMIRIHAQCAVWTGRLLRSLYEAGIDLESAPAYFVGGGAMLLESHLSKKDKARHLQTVFIRDLHANAAGYESVSRQSA